MSKHDSGLDISLYKGLPPGRVTVSNVSTEVAFQSAFFKGLEEIFGDDFEDDERESIDPFAK